MPLGKKVVSDVRSVVTEHHEVVHFQKVSAGYAYDCPDLCLANESLGSRDRASLESRIQSHRNPSTHERASSFPVSARTLAAWSGSQLPDDFQSELDLAGRRGGLVQRGWQTAAVRVKDRIVLSECIQKTW